MSYGLGTRALLSPSSAPDCMFSGMSLHFSHLPSACSVIMAFIRALDSLVVMIKWAFKFVSTLKTVTCQVQRQGLFTLMSFGATVWQHSLWAMTTLMSSARVLLPASSLETMPLDWMTNAAICKSSQREHQAATHFQGFVIKKFGDHVVRKVSTLIVENPPNNPNL